MGLPGILRSRCTPRYLYYIVQWFHQLPSNQISKLVVEPKVNRTLVDSFTPLDQSSYQKQRDEVILFNSKNSSFYQDIVRRSVPE